MSGLTTTRRQRRALAADNRKLPSVLQQIPRTEWPEYRPPGLSQVWRSREFLVQIFEHEPNVRITVCRTDVGEGERWVDGITWDDLQRLKRECGFGDHCAVELFPPDSEIVNVANMRHLWLVDPPAFMWRAQSSTDPNRGG